LFCRTKSSSNEAKFRRLQLSDDYPIFQHDSIRWINNKTTALNGILDNKIYLEQEKKWKMSFCFYVKEKKRKRKDTACRLENFVVEFIFN